MSQPPVSYTTARSASALRRWLWSLGLIVVVVLPVLLVLEVMLLRQVGPRPRANAALVEADSDPGPATVPSPAPAQSKEPVRPKPKPATASHPLPVEPAEKKPVEQKQEEKPAVVKSSPAMLKPGPVTIELREALGGLTGSHLSQAHLSIGLIADAVEKDLYTEAQGRNLLAHVAGLLDAVGKLLQRLPPKTLPADEHKHLESARAVEKLLRSQIEELRRYWSSGDKQHADRFQKVRKQSGTALQELFNPPS